MTTKPTIEANKAVGSVLTAAEWNTNDLQGMNYLFELLSGVNTDKVPGSALAAPLNLSGAVQFTTSIAAPSGYSALYPNSDGYFHFDNPFGETGWRWVYNGGTPTFELGYSGAIKLNGQTRRWPSKGTSGSFNASYNSEVQTNITLEDSSFTPVSAIACIKSPAAAALYAPRIVSYGAGTVTVGVTSPSSPAPTGVVVEVWAV